MGFYVLHDSDADVAVLYDSTSEAPIATYGFTGPGGRELAESFLAYLNTEHNRARVLSSHVLGVVPRKDDPRCYSEVGLEAARERWYELCTTGETGDLSAYGLAVWEWWQGSRDEPAPEPEDVNG